MPHRAPTHSSPRLNGRRHETRLDERERGTAHERGYDHRWRRLRAAKLRASPLCEHCEARGRTTVATEVDHIKPIRERPDLRLDWSNLQSLCNPCHQRKTHGKKPAVGADGYPAS